MRPGPITRCDDPAVHQRHPPPHHAGEGVLQPHGHGLPGTSPGHPQRARGAPRGVAQRVKPEGEATRYTPGDFIRDAALTAGIMAGISALCAAVGDKDTDTPPPASKLNREHPETMKPFVERLAEEMPE